MSVLNIKTILKGLLNDHLTTTPDQGLKPTLLSNDWDQLFVKHGSVRVVVDAATSTTGEIGIFTCRAASGIVVTKCSVLAEGALTSSLTDYSTLNLNQRTAGATAVVVGSLVTKTTAGSGSGDWVANNAYAFSMTDGITIANGDTLTIQQTKTGAGVATPARQYQLSYYEL
jgi:hypothetical protein